jgi:cytoskeletal protein CcmA (bactofilin family)
MNWKEPTMRKRLVSFAAVLVVLCLAAVAGHAGTTHLNHLNLEPVSGLDDYSLTCDDTSGTIVFYVDAAGDVVLTETGGSTSDPDFSVAGYSKFGGAVEIDGAVLLDGNVTLGDAAGDVITLTGYMTRLRVGTGSTADLTHGSDDAFIEGQLEVDGAARFDGAVTLGDAASDVITLTGYMTRLRVGTGSTADLTHGADDAFIEGQLEVDGAVRFDGSVTIGDAGADVLTINADTVTLTAGCAVTVPDTAYFSRVRVGTGSTADLTLVDDDAFIEGQLEVDGAVRLDGNVTLGDAASDVITLTGYMTRLRVGTGATADLTHGVDDAFIEGQLEVDGAARFDGNVTLGDAASDILTLTGYVTQLRVGTGSTADLTHGADDVFVEGQLEVDGAARFDGNVTLGDAVTDILTLTGYVTQLRVGTGSTADLTHGADDVFVEGQLEVDGAVQLDGNVTLGNALTDIVQCKGTFVVDENSACPYAATTPEGTFWKTSTTTAVDTNFMKTGVNNVTADKVYIFMNGKWCLITTD